MMSNVETPRYPMEGGSSQSSLNHHQQQQQQQQQPTILSRYESQKRRDWNTFGQYLKNQRPPVTLSQCNCNHVLEFLRYLDQFGKTKVHLHGCVFFGQPDPPAPCTCPLRQAWGSLDALIGRLRAAYEENGGLPESNPLGMERFEFIYARLRKVKLKLEGFLTRRKRRRRIRISSISSSLLLLLLLLLLPQAAKLKQRDPKGPALSSPGGCRQLKSVLRSV